MNDATLTRLAGHFALMSLFAIGGANSAVPEMQRVAVEVEHWMTARQFTGLFAFYIGRISERMKGEVWTAVQSGLLPISIGLIAASGFVVASAAAHNAAAVLVTVFAAVLCSARRLNPLWIFAAAALLGIADLL